MERRITSLFSVFFILLAVLGNVQSSKILFLFPSPSPSHDVIGQSLAKGLVERGHEVR